MNLLIAGRAGSARWLQKKCINLLLSNLSNIPERRLAPNDDKRGHQIVTDMGGHRQSTDVSYLVLLCYLWQNRWFPAAFCVSVPLQFGIPRYQYHLQMFWKPRATFIVRGLTFMLSITEVLKLIWVRGEVSFITSWKRPEYMNFIALDFIQLRIQCNSSKHITSYFV